MASLWFPIDSAYDFAKLSTTKYLRRIASYVAKFTKLVHPAEGEKV